MRTIKQQKRTFEYHTSTKKLYIYIDYMVTQKQALVSSASSTTSTTLSSSLSSSLSTMDELCNEFLLKQSDRTTVFNLQPIVQPLLLSQSSQSHSNSQSLLSSLSKIDNIHKLQLLVYNRSWNDVIVLIESLLYGTITSHLAPIYTMLACSIQQQQQQQNTNDNNNNNNTINYLVLDDTLALDSHKVELLWVMYIHVTALLKLKLYNKLSTLLNTWTFCYHHKQYTKNRSPKWISLSFHVFIVSCLAYTSTINSNSNTNTTTTTQSSLSVTNPAIDMLWKIRSELLDNNNNDKNSNTIPTLHSSSLVERSAAIIQIELSLANIFISNKCWRMVLECYERIMSNDTSTVSVVDTNDDNTNNNNNNNNTQQQQQNKVHVLDVLCNEELVRYHPNETSKIDCDTLRTACHIELLSRQGCILLQIGAIEQGNELYNQAIELWETICTTATNTTSCDIKTSKIFAIQVVPIQLHINQGLLSFSQGNHSLAYKHFTNAIQTIRTIQQNESFYIKDFDPIIKNIDHTNTTTITPIVLLIFNQSMKRDYINTVYCEINNNIALCQLYTCQLHNSINTIESLIRENPILYLTDRIIMNLCTLYELGYDTNESNNKKKLIQYITIQRLHIHDIISDCFRIV